MSRCEALFCVAALCLVAGSAVGCKDDSPPPLAARFDYVMPARFEAPDLDAPEIGYEAYTAGDLHPDVWMVELDACDSTGSIVEYAWSIDGTPVGSFGRCDGLVYPFAAEGTYSVSLVVEDEDGELESRTADIVVNDLLIFGIGDSFGSGEGNPDVELSLTALERLDAARVELDDAAAALEMARRDDLALQQGVEPDATSSDGPRPASALARYDAAEAALGDAVAISRARWQDRRCHRSAFSGQVRAAEMIEKADPHTSVTFVHLACSGARVHKGLVGGYLGVEEEEPLLPPQIERVDEIAEGREIDALMLSIGGNDVNFASIIEACMLGEDCHESPATVDPLLADIVDFVCPLVGPFESDCTGYFDSLLPPADLDARHVFDVHSSSEDVGGMDIRQDGNDDLPDNYRDLAEAIADLPGMSPDGQQGRVYLTEIPDITRNGAGQVCGFDPTKLAVAALYEIPLVTKPELTWASDYVIVELRETMQAAAAEHGWQFVDGITAAFWRHGYCSSDTWVVRLQNSFLLQGDQYGAVHPNRLGHGAYAKALAGAIAP